MSGSQLIAALENVQAEIMSRHSEFDGHDLPVIITGTGTGKRRGGVLFGHFCANRWTDEEAKRPELFVAGEAMAAGAVEVLTTLLHETAHFVGAVEDISNTRGNYHNKRFLRLAERLGMEMGEKSKTLGFSDVKLTDETKTSYESELQLLSDELTLYTDKVSVSTRSGGTDRNLGKAMCSCPDRSLRVSKKQLSEAPIICGACNEEFLH